jgi:surface antigen
VTPLYSPRLRLCAACVLAPIVAGCKSSALVPAQPIAYAPGNEGAVGLLGTAIGLDVTDADRKSGLNAEYRALETGEPGVALNWRGRSGSAGAIVPGPRYRVNDYDCRQFTHTVTSGEKTESATAAACRGLDGVWRVVG